VKRYASLSSESSAVRGKLQTALYYARKDNREKRKKIHETLQGLAPVAIIGDMVDNGDGTYDLTGPGAIRFFFDHADLVDGAVYRISVPLVAKGDADVEADLCDDTFADVSKIGNNVFTASFEGYSETFNFVDVASDDPFTVGTVSMTRIEV